MIELRPNSLHHLLPLAKTYVPKWPSSASIVWPTLEDIDRKLRPFVVCQPQGRYVTAGLEFLVSNILQ